MLKISRNQNHHQIKKQHIYQIGTIYYISKFYITFIWYANLLCYICHISLLIFLIIYYYHGCLCQIFLLKSSLLVANIQIFLSFYYTKEK
jgi:hypothetical protein